MNINLIEVMFSIGVLTAVYKYFEKQTFDVTMIKSSINNKKYLVRNIDDKDKAADMLANIATRLKTIVEYLDKNNANALFNKFMSKAFYKKHGLTKSPTEDDMHKTDEDREKRIKKLQRDLERLANNFNEDNIHENTPNAKYTSYSVNKGEKIFFCLRNKRTEQLVDLNTMMFVAIHELAHLMTEEIGHPPIFWDNFKFLLKVALDKKVYKYVDFNNYPKEYCGIKITDTPL
jgi:predicted metal-dependent hydrolase